MCFDYRHAPTDLTNFLIEPIKEIIKVDPIFTFRGKKVHTGSKSQSTAPKGSLVRKKKQDDDDLKGLYLEVLNDQNAQIASDLKIFFASDFWLNRCNIERKLTHGLDYFYDGDELASNTNLLLKHFQVVVNICYAEAARIVFIDRNVKQKLKKSSHQLIDHFQSSTEGFTQEYLFYID